MRFDLLNFIQNLKFGDKKVDETFMTEWSNQKVQNSRKKTQIENFRDSSIKTGIFLIDLLNAVEPGCINYDLVTPGETCKKIRN